MYYLRPYRCLFFLVFIFQLYQKAQAQNGDQVLDGIGETGMIARYNFKGDLKDWSRNNLHAKPEGSDVKFVQDQKFGSVLSLGENSNAYVSLPLDVLSNTESISVSGWFYLQDIRDNQVFFDLMLKDGYHIVAGVNKTKQGNELVIKSAAGKDRRRLSANRNGKDGYKLSANKWMHIAVVLDISSKELKGYVDGKLFSRNSLNATDLKAFPKDDQRDERHFYIGRSLHASDSSLNGLVHDFRIYRIALNTDQVAGIYRNATQSQNAVNTTAGKVDPLQQFSKSESQLYHAFLQTVPDINVETEIGHLPRLPAYIPAVYKNGYKGSEVRVIWPADTNNSAVNKAGKYVVRGRVAGTDFHPGAIVTVKDIPSTNSPKQKLQSFPLSQVMLREDASAQKTKFIENRDKFINTLAGTDPNSFLYMFRHAFGQQQPDGAKPLGVWDSRDTKLRGHATGHYLSALAQAYAGTGYDKTLHQNFAGKMTTMVDALYGLSRLSGNPAKKGGSFVSDPTLIPFGPSKTAYNSDLSDEGIRKDYWNWGKGFISAYPPDQFIMLEKGAKYGGQVHQIWAPYYTLHKIMAGLLDVYELSENKGENGLKEMEITRKKALEIAEGMGDWVYARLSKVPTDTLIKMWNTYIAGEYGGMNEVMSRLYRITNNPDHLNAAKLFDNIRLFFGDAGHSHGLAKNVDLFRGLHANQHIPQVVGSIETYRVSDEPEYYKVAENFWNKVINDYSYSIGGVAGARNPANAECFVREPGSIYENGFSPDGQNETCATYNMLKLTGNLFMYDPRTELMDYYERGLYNHILASVDENNPGNTYHIPLNPGAIKQFGNHDMTGFTCCNGTAIESNTKLQNTIYYRSIEKDALYVNLFVSSDLNWEEKKIRIEQRTNFPGEDHTTLTVKGSGNFDIHVRVPSWATKGFVVRINGEEQQHDAKPGSYLRLSRAWKDGDKIELKMPFTFYLNPVPDQPNIASLFYGPVLLAAQESEPMKEWRKITLDAKDLGNSIKGDPSKLEFKIGDVIFKPFYETYGRHSVYMDVRLR